MLGEVHARPFTPIESPRRVLHFAFETTAEQGEADRAALSEFCAGRAIPPPKPGSKHHRVALGATALRWEQHSEFTTYTWELPGEVAAGALPFHPPASGLAQPMGFVPQPGPLLVAVDLHLNGEATNLERLFDPASLAVAETGDGAALFATDFQADPAGFVRILIVDRGLGSARAGALVQRVIEIETYRMLALLGIAGGAAAEPLGEPDRNAARRGHRGDAPAPKGSRPTTACSTSSRHSPPRSKPVRRRACSGSARAGRTTRSCTCGCRRSASARFPAPPPGRRSWRAAWRPALRTCAALQERQANLSSKLARAANLLRTRVDVELQQQNRDLLKSMNRRTQLQLRLQATVEGLSVAAISYYVVGLFGYIVKGLHDSGAAGRALARHCGRSCRSWCC